MVWGIAETVAVIANINSVNAKNLSTFPLNFSLFCEIQSFQLLYFPCSEALQQPTTHALWDFLYKPLGGEAFNWYVGAGPFVGLGDDFILGGVGEVGIEYHFTGAPLALGIDWRPAFRLIDETDFSANGFGFNLRYVFGGK